MKKETNSLSLVLSNINNIIIEYKKRSSDFEETLTLDISDLEFIYNNIKSQIDEFIKYKQFKLLSEMYSNLINIKKMIMDSKEKKYKLVDSDIKILKQSAELIYKIENSLNDDNKQSNNIEISSFINNLFNNNDKI